MQLALKKRKNFSNDTLKKALKIAWPAVVESFFIAFTGLIDTLMVSSLSSYAVAAVGLTMQPKFIGLALFIAIGVATSAVVARRFGEGKKDLANKTLLTALYFTIISAIIVSLIFVFGADFIIKICGSTVNTHNDAVTYLKIIMGGMIFNCIQVTINSAQRGAGNTKITMTTNVTSSLVNITFNYLLIGGKFGFPALGIKGAAIATVLGAVVSSIMSIASLINKDRFLSLVYIVKEKLRPTLDAFKILVRFGYSVFIEQVLLRIGFAATAIMAANLGDNSMSAHQVAMNMMGITFSFGDGLQAAAVALIGKSLGENELEKAKEYGRTCQFIGAIISVVLAIVVFFSAKSIMQAFFPKNPEIVDIGVELMWLQIIIILFQIVQVIYMGCLRGAGDTLYTAIITTTSVTVIRTVVSYLFGFTFGLGILGVWVGVLADQITRFICSGIRFKRGKWVKIKI